MAETKDKVVTVESLSALHEHNKETYMTNNNPTGTGSLSLNRKADTNIGECSASIGYNCAAYAPGSVAEGQETVATEAGQHVQGLLNIIDMDGIYAHIVGNGYNEVAVDDKGVSTAYTIRSNAHTLDWDGNAWFAGDVYVGGTSQNDTNATKLVKTTNVMSIEYGDELPESGTVGRIFFKRFTDV